MAELNFKTSMALGRERFISPFSLMKFIMTEQDTEEQFSVIYRDLKASGTLPYKRNTKLAEPKTGAASRELRVEGNAQFAVDLPRALLSYNRSVCAAPYPSVDGDESLELALAFANRSAVYAKMNRNEAALGDIERALSFDYPDDLKYKLLERRTGCYRALGMRDEAIQSCQESIAVLPLATEPPADKLASLTSTLKSIKIRGGKQQRGGRTGPEKMPVLKKTYGDHPRIPAASDCLDVRHSEEFGHHAVATRDIDPGDILVIEHSFTSILSSSHYYAYCYHCLKRSDAMIPCKQCSLVMFCKDACRDLAWEGYHRIECRVLPLLNEHDIGHVPPFSLRMLLVAVSRYADNSLDKLWLLVRELEESRKNVKPDSGFGQVGQPYGVSRDYAAIHYLDRERAFRVDVGGQKNLDVFLVTAINSAIIVNCLDCHTDLFRRPKGSADRSRPSAGELRVFAGRLIMRYHQIVAANARAVIDYEYDADSTSFCGTDYGVTLHNVLSFFNHSCCHNTSGFNYDGASSFVAANRPIKKGEQLFVSYGIDFAERNLAERTSFLLEMNTICCCEACLNDWPTADEMLDDHVPKMICSKCWATLEPAHEAVTRCPRCRTRKMVQQTAKLQNTMGDKLKNVNKRVYRRSQLHRDFVPQLATSLKFIHNHFQMPNLMSLLSQHCLFENFRRYNNYSGIWAPEKSEP